MDRGQKEIIKKIQKILRLAHQAGSEDEAKTAMQMAHDLLAKYDLSLSDLNDFTEDRCTEEFCTFSGKFISGHIKLLVDAMCVLFQCRTIFIKDKKHNKISVNFIGLGADPIVACQTYQFLLEFASRMAQERKIKSSAKSDYFFGFSHSILKRVLEINQQKQPCQQENSLVLVKEAVINRYIKHTYENAKTVREARQRYETDSLMAGLVDGEKASFARPVNERSTKALA